MNKSVTVRKKNILMNDLKMRQLDPEYKETVYDTITELYMDVPIGIKNHGLTIKEICSVLGITDKEEIRNIRVRICHYAIEKIKEGFPFGGIKSDKKYMQYNFCANEKEWQAIQTKKIKAIQKNVNNLMLHFDEEDLISYAGEKLLEECEQQLQLFE